MTYTISLRETLVKTYRVSYGLSEASVFCLHRSNSDSSDSGASGLSLRAAAALPDVRAPSLYRCFPQKEALEAAVAANVLAAVLAALPTASESEDPGTGFRQTAEAYLRFAREHFSLYALVMQNRLSRAYETEAGQDVWNLLVAVASDVSGRPDDTAAAVAT